MDWTKAAGKNGDWCAAKKGENVLGNNYQNNENEKPVKTLFNLKTGAKPSKVFMPAPKKW